MSARTQTKIDPRSPKPSEAKLPTLPITRAETADCGDGGCGCGCGLPITRR